MKKPWLSAILNGILPGLGYIYNGRRILVGLLLFSYSLISLLLVELDMPALVSDLMWLRLNPILIGMVVGLLLHVAMAIDSYREAVELNSRGRRGRRA